VAKEFEKVSVSDEDERDPEGEILEEAADVPSGAPPAKTATGTRSSSDGGGKRPKKTAEQASLFARISQFVRDTRAEMRRVSWPTLVMVRNSTLITLVAVVFFAIYLFAVDRVWTFLIDNLRGWLGG
jgi:preprotein translocase subunit SecE